MPSLNLKKNDVPFLLGGSGELTVDTGNLKLNKPIPSDTAQVLSVAFKAAGSQSVGLGQAGTVKIGVSTTANLDLTPIFPTSTGAAAKLLKAHGVADFFKGGANADKVVLCFNAGASGDITAAGSFQYSVLKPTVQLEAGVDAGYAYLRALDGLAPIEEILPAFFSTMRLPEQGTRAPEAGEAIFLRYGGYLGLAAEVSAGYKLAGTKSFSLGQLALSEKYDLSILGKVGLSARVAGQFAILVTAADMPGWARVQVRRQRSKEMKVAADVDVTFKNELTNLPATANEFLGAVLGVNAKNFLNVFEKAVELSDFEKFKGAVDGLARKYVESVIGKGFDKLASVPEFTKFLATVNTVVTSYQQLEDRAITLFDRYFDKLAELTGFLEKIEALQQAGLEQLRNHLTPELWNILAQLTDGDPLGFLLDQITIKGQKVSSLAELKKRAGAVLSLIRDDAHAEIRRVIGIAKQQFGIDKLFAELAKVDTVDELHALANEKVGLFVTRLVGRTLESSKDVKAAFEQVHAVLVKIDSFGQKLFESFKEATNGAYKLGLHAEYSRASETDALIDVAINMADPRGAGLLAEAGKGDFAQITGASDTSLVRLREGVLTHKARRESAFKVNVVGWHLNYKYSGFDRVITSTEQRLVPSDQGITIFTTAELEVERERKRQQETVHVNFLLRALGESAKVVAAEAGNFGYLIDALTSLTARYQLNFTDDDTSEMELTDYLAFAKELGLDKKGATAAELAAQLPRASNGGFGSIETSYDIRFGQSAVEALLQVTTVDAAKERAIRTAMRLMVLSNYLKSQVQHDVAFAYATPEVFQVFDSEAFATFTSKARSFSVRVPVTGVNAPSKVDLNQTELRVLGTLYHIENKFIDAIKRLYRLLGGKKLAPAKFEDALAEFGDALNEFDRFDQTTSDRGIGTNTVFAMFDKLVRLQGGDAASTSLLRMTSHAGDHKVEKLFLSDQAAAAS